MSAAAACPSAPGLARGCAAARPQRAVSRRSCCSVLSRSVRSQAQPSERATAVAPPPPSPPLLEQQQIGSSSSGSSAPDGHSLAEQQPGQQQRTLQLSAAAASLGGLGAAVYAALSSQPQLPPLSEVAGPAAAALLGAPLLAFLAAKAVLRDQLHLELHRGRLYLTAGVPSQGPPVTPGAVVVRPTGDVRGNGAYAAALIPKGTYLGDYTGELLDRAAFFQRYPDGVGDFAAASDDEWTIDAAGAVGNTACFHPVHMNHSRGRANVKRFYARAQRRISFFTTRDVQPGEELLYDYGRAYWRGRADQELP